MNTFLIDCCVCIQCVILKINGNNNENSGWLIFICILYKYCLTLLENCMEDCCVHGKSVIFGLFPLVFSFLPAESLRLLSLNI